MQNEKIRNIVICPLKARIGEPEETVIARQWLCKHVSMETRSRDRYNRGTVGGGVLCWFRAELYNEQSVRDRDAYGATNVAPTQKDRPLPSSEEATLLQHVHV
jgi:hypothetical protein